MTLRAIAQQMGVTHSAIREQENKGLRKLRRTKLKRLLQDRYDVVLSTAYRSGVNRFKTTWTSSTERAAFLLDEMATDSKKSDYKLDMSQPDNLLKQLFA